jgi:hypothetical protein
MHGVFFMKDDYDAVSVAVVAWLHCCVTGSRLFAAMLLLIVMQPHWAAELPFNLGRSS